MSLFFSLIFFLTSLPPIQETIPRTPFAYVGLQPREVITLDPHHSPLLEKGYLELVANLSPTFSEKEILMQVADYVAQTLFDLQKCSEAAVAVLIDQLYPSVKEPEISLEVFLAAHTGVCRHLALTTTYLIDRLIQDGYLEGKAFLIRDFVRCGRHAWTLFLSEEGAWHIDAYWRVLADGKTKDGFAQLCRVYGPNTMQRQQKRWTP